MGKDRPLRPTKDRHSQKTHARKAKARQRFQVLSLSFLCLTLGLLIALQFKAVSTGSYRVLGDSAAEKELRSEIEKLRAQNADLTRSVRDKTENLNALIREHQGNEDQERQMKVKMEQIKRFAGLTDVTGSGAILTIEGNNATDISAENLAALLNEFKAGGVTALSVNGERVSALTEVRATGEASQNIVMNGRTISSDHRYEVRMLGDVTQIKNVWLILSPFRNEWARLGLTANIEYVDQLTIKALREDSPAYQQALSRGAS